MRGVRKLIEQREPCHSVRFAQRLEVVFQGAGIARDVENTIEALQGGAAFQVQTGAGWVHEHGGKIVGVQVDVSILQASEFTFLVECLGHFIGGQPDDLKVLDAVGLDIVLGGLHR